MKNYNKNYWSKRVQSYNNTNWVKDEELIKAFLKFVPEKEFNSILEIGIGTGALAEKMVEKIGPIKGIDISLDMISKISNPKIDAKIGDANNLEFNESSFDLIYMRNVIHYIDSPEDVFKEVGRCLKADGYFLFSQVIPPNDSISKEYDWLIGRNIHYPTKTEILEWMYEFKIIKEKEFILTSQSIMNWLENTCTNKSKKDEVISRHIDSSKEYKSFVNYFRTKDDIIVDIKHFMILLKNIK